MRAIDLFAGAGGFTAGATQAGAHVVWAANHWPIAVATHAANHPETQHECQDLRQADWTKLPQFDLLLASPACQGHSEASQPKRRAFHDEMRATAWAVVDCADVTEPRAIVVENVPQFPEWRLYPSWRNALERIGYTLQEHVLVATDFGVPQLRRRLFIVATRKPVALSFPRLGVAPAFAPCVDWSAGGWRPTSEATPGAQARFAKARARIGKTFLSQHVTGHPGVPLDEPIRTITCANQHWTIVDGDRYRYLTPRELARGMSFADTYRIGGTTAEQTKQIGNAVPPLMAAGVVARVMEAA